MFKFNIVTEWVEWRTSGGRIAPLTIVSIRHPNQKMLDIFADRWQYWTEWRQDEQGAYLVHVVSGQVSEEWVKEIMSDLRSVEESIQKHLKSLKMFLQVIDEVKLED